MPITIPFASRTINAFNLLSLIGVAAALMQSAFLLNYLSLNWWLLPVMFITSSVTFLFTAMLTKIFTGKEDHVMLRYFIVILLVNYFVIGLLDLPAFPYLDILALGYGTIIFFGRLGCFMVGCCHGRPNSFGVCYSAEHVKEGFTSYYSGIRLFPIQLAEAAGLLVIVAVSVFVLLKGFPDGRAFTVFISLYGVLRFVLEFFRGDSERPYLLSFSEAQWTIAGLNIFLLYGGWLFWFSITPWQVAISTGIFLGLAGFGLARILNPRLRFNDPNHVREIMTVKTGLPGNEITVKTTSCRVNISGGHIGKDVQYTVSGNNWKLVRQDVVRLASILKLRHPDAEPEILARSNDIFQVIFRTQ